MSFNGKRSILLIVFTLGLSYSATNEATGRVKIIKISKWVGTENYPNDSLYVETDQEILTNPASCSKLEGYHVKATSAVSRSVVLAAITSGADPGLNIGGGGCAPENRPIIVQVALYQ
ncbi:hypothetical protein [Microbulbifer yueqingensis]|uniref:hypothetical protein n=1 Tax=Microbulbifer yueqingensis TaxID=658219 RepID=UPI00111430D8|nr:hypothetical protein [Microbulbifer yueqingensis]